MYTVYGIRCKENGKIYIGCTCRQVEERITAHFNELRRRGKTYRNSKGERELTPWQIDFNQFGEDAFEFYILEKDVSEDNHRETETNWIEEYRSYDKRYGYNVKKGSAKRKHYYEIKEELPENLYKGVN